MIPAEIVDEIKRNVTVRDVALKYGLHFNCDGFTCCPFHGEKAPSMKLYDGDRGFYCFGCHTGGSAIDLVMKLNGQTFSQAVRQINDDFNLGLQLDRKLSAQENLRAAQVASERKRQANIQAQKKREIESILNDLACRYLFLLQLADQYRPSRKSHEFSPQWCYAMDQLPAARDEYERFEYERYKLCQTRTM